MDLVIPTLGRCAGNLQATLHQLAAAELDPIVVIQQHEEAWWSTYHSRTVVLPKYVKGIAATRDWIIHDMPGDDHVVMLDDDLHFAVRREDDPTKFRQPTTGDIRAMVNALDASLEKYPHVSIGSREGGNRNIEPVMFNTRMMRVLGYRRSYMKKHKICFTPMMVMEDFHVTLQILRRGDDCAVLNNWVSNQAGGSAASGGCSTFRTMEMQAEEARRLARLHPGFVKVVQKKTKTAWGGAERTDVVVQWKQARRAEERND